MKDFLKNNGHILFSVIVAVCVYGIITQLSFIAVQKETLYLIAWDAFLLSYLGLTIRLFVSIPQSKMEAWSHEAYEKKSTMLVLVSITSVVSIIAIVREMSIGADLTGWRSAFHVGLTFMTLVVSWLFMHTLFALYYAHTYYDAENNSIYPLDFPYEDAPDYWDFVYFAFGIGATGQTADISFTSRKLRRVGTFHSVLSFFFNTAVLALMMEMAASLIS